LLHFFDLKQSDFKTQNKKLFLSVENQKTVSVSSAAKSRISSLSLPQNAAGMILKTTFPLLFLLFFFAFCKTASVMNAPKPPEQYYAAQEASTPSTLSIPVSINSGDLVRSLNSRMSGPLYEDYSYTDNNNDGLMLNLWKHQDVTLFLSGNTIKYRVPLKIWMKKKLIVGEAEVEGIIALGMKTTYNIREDWSLNTKTEVEFHEWIAKPVLKTGLGNLNIEPVVNIALVRSKKTIAESIDQYVSQQLSLKPYVEDAWNALQEPVLLDSAYKMWVKTTPVAIGMTPLYTDLNTIRAKISVECINEVSFGEKPAFRANSNLPNLKNLPDAGDDFQLHFATDVPYPEAERLARGMMVGQVFESGKNKVRIEDIQMWGNNDRLVVNSKLSGAFNGNIYFIGRPKFDSLRNRIEVADLDFHVDTRNFLHRSASWLFQGTIKRQMAAAMSFPLDENVAEIKKTAQESLTNYEIQPGVMLNGVIDSVAVQGVRLTPTGIRVDLFSKGKVMVDVKGL
jgi:Domain of unknown function (DUF4403)